MQVNGCPNKDKTLSKVVQLDSTIMIGQESFWHMRSRDPLSSILIIGSAHAMDDGKISWLANGKRIEKFNYL